MPWLPPSRLPPVAVRGCPDRLPAMSREWKPGDLAMVLCPDVERRQARYLAPKSGVCEEAAWQFADDSLLLVSKSNARPLVAIDPEDREQVERLYKTFVTTAAVNRADALQAALREFANPTPPKPEEPTGLGAVVEDAEGERWVWLAQGAEGAHWHRVGTPEKRANWHQITAVRVLSEGVPS